jgi:hypothetical protein
MIPKNKPMKYISFLLFLFMFNTVRSQRMIDLISNDMDASVVSSIDAGPSSIKSNPALATIAKNSMAGLYAENRYGLIDLGLIRVSGLMPIFKDQALVLNWTRMGTNEYHEDRVDIGFARKLNEKTSLGISGGIERYTKSKMDIVYAPRASVGFFFKPNSKSEFGFVFQNPWEPFFTHVDGRSSGTIFMLGFGYHPSSQIHLKMDVNKGINTDWNLLIGATLHVSPKMCVQYNFHSQSYAHHLGAVLHRKKGSLRIYFSYQSMLGVSGGSGIFFTKKQRE